MHYIVCSSLNFHSVQNNFSSICTDDLSQNKVATQSTTALSSTNAFAAGNAVDRDITTCMRTEDIGTTGSYRTVWWRVDLGGVYNINSVNILFKNYNEYGTVYLYYFIYYM